MGSLCFKTDNTARAPNYEQLSAKDKEAGQLEMSTAGDKDKDHMMNTERWFEQQGKLLSDPEKFLASYPNYLNDQKRLQKYWKNISLEPPLGDNEISRKKNDVLKPEWKYILRKGAQVKDIRDIILNIFRRKYASNDIEYDALLKNAFETIPTTFKNVPLFTHEEHLEDVLKVHFLNEDGLIALKRIMWIFRKSFPQLQYCPLLIQVTSMLLIFLSESETYCVVRFMLEDSVKQLDERGQYKAQEMRSVRWHFTTRKEDFERFVQSFFETVKVRSNGFEQLVQHFTKIGFDYLSLFQEWFRHIFLGIVPFPLALTMFLAYLNEGIKIYYRMGYALCSVLKKKLFLEHQAEQMPRVILEHSTKIDEKTRKKIIQKAYSLRLTRIKQRFSKYDVEEDKLQEAKVYYRPLISHASTIIKDEMFEVLWEWIPNVNKLTDPVLLFSSYKDGFSLRNLYKMCEGYEGYPMLILIKSNHNTIFGAFVDDVFKVTPECKHVGSNDTFVFMLYPNETKFSATDKNRDHLLATREYFSLGSGGDGNAIYLDDELLHGNTYQSETYENVQLNGKSNKSESSFQCMGIEVYLLE